MLRDQGTRNAGADTFRSQNPAYEALKSLILSCKIKPGDRLVEGEVALEMGFPRGSVHQAFDRLMFEDLVDIVPRKGIIVKPIVIADLLQMVEVRRVNEIHCARRAAESASREQIAQMDEIIQAAQIAVDAHDIETMMRLDGAFHRALAACSNNRELTDVIGRLNDRSSRFWYISSATTEHHSRFQAHHLAIVDAVRKNSPDSAEAAMQEHIESFRQSVIRQFGR